MGIVGFLSSNHLPAHVQCCTMLMSLTSVFPTQVMFCLSCTSKVHGIVITEEVPVVVHVDGVLITVLTGDGLGVVPDEEVTVGLPTWTYKSVATAPCS